MPRPKRGVTLNNMFDVSNYFNRMIQDKRLLSQTDDFDLIYAAEKAFKKLPKKYKQVGEKKAFCEAFQAWVDKYIPPAQWQRCLSTLRQKRSKKKLELRRLDLHHDIYITVKNYAEKLGLSLGAAIYKAVKPQLDEIYDKEFAKKNTKEKKKSHEVTIIM